MVIVTVDTFVLGVMTVPTTCGQTCCSALAFAIGDCCIGGPCIDDKQYQGASEMYDVQCYSFGSALSSPHEHELTQKDRTELMPC